MWRGRDYVTQINVSRTLKGEESNRFPVVDRINDVVGLRGFSNLIELLFGLGVLCFSWTFVSLYIVFTRQFR